MTAAVHPRLDERARDPILGLPVPFASEVDGGRSDQAVIVKKRAIRCALSRVCGVCGSSLSWPVAFMGTEDEAAEGLFAYPPLHLSCAESALEVFGPINGGVLGRPQVVEHWAVVTTGGFDLIRPTRRGAPVLFRPNSIFVG